MFRELDIPKLYVIKKQICIRYFFIVISIFSFYSIYYTYENINPLNYLFIICNIIHLLWLYIPCRLNYDSLRPLIPFYFILITLTLYPNSLYLWQVGQLTPFIWYIIVPLAAIIFFPPRIVIFWSILVVVSICSIFLISPLLPYDILLLTKKQQTIVNISTILSWMGLVFFFIYYIYKINQIKEKYLQQEIETFHEPDSEKINNIGEEADNGNEKYNSLYTDILNYFIEKKPYCDPNFTILQLALDLNTNTKYVSKAIHNNKSVNFNVFVNIYRINFVKEMLMQDIQNKYTIRHIYTSAGFKHQSTFNKAFKQIEGITPSDYIKSLTKEKTPY